MPADAKPRRVALAAIIAAVVITIPLIVWMRAQERSTARGRPWGELSKPEQEDLSQAGYRRLPLRTLESLQSTDGVVAFLSGLPSLAGSAGAPVSHAPEEAQSGPGAAADRARLIQLSAELIWHRYMQHDVEVYKAWRRGMGDELKPTPRLMKIWTVASDYEIIFDEPYPGDDRFEEVFDRFWLQGIDGENRACRVTGICTGDGAEFLVFGSITAEEPGAWPRPQNRDGVPIWVGSRSATFRNWWTPPRELPDLLADHPAVKVAVLGLIVSYADGVRLPMLIQYFQDPASGHWSIHHLVVQNEPDGRMLGPTEY